MSTCADSKTTPVTEAYAENHERIFGKPQQRRGGRSVYRPGHPKANERGFVHVDDLGDEPAATSDQRVPVLTDRYMEGVRAVDGTDIGSRTKRREYMKVKNLADADDFKGEWKKAAAERAKVHEAAKSGKAQGVDRKARREAIARAVYKHCKP